MKAHFQRAIWPLTATLAFFGLALIEYPLGKPRRFLSLIYATVAFSMQLGMYIVFIMLSDLMTGTILVNSVYRVMMFCCNFIILTAICLTHWHGKRYYKCIERFNEVDKTLRDLGIETDYSKLRRVTLLTLITWAIVSILLTTYDYMYYEEEYLNKYFALLLFSINMPLNIGMLTDVLFWLVLGYSGTRFDYINNALRKLTTDDNNCASCFRNSERISVRGVFVPDKRARRIIWTVMHLHFELCKILRDISTVFEIQMSLQMCFDCVFLLCSVIFTFRLILLPFESDNVSNVLKIWSSALPYFVDLIVTNHLCETVGAKARVVCDLAVQLMRCMDDEGMREDLSFIVLQMKLKPLKFSCLGLYDFGYHLMYKMFGSVLTIAVIILQQKTGLEI